MNDPTCIGIFSGMGLLDHAMCGSGFRLLAAAELVERYADVHRKNLPEGGAGAAVLAMDCSEKDSPARLLKASGLRRGELDMLQGGPPCQAHSAAGKHGGIDDPRGRLLWEPWRFAEALRPKIILVENVQGLLSSALPGLPDRSLFTQWLADKPRGYQRVHWRLLNAKDFGTGENRPRVFILALRDDVRGDVVWPAKTHSAEALAWDQWVTGDYWRRHGIKRPKKPPVRPNWFARAVKRVLASGVKPATLPYRTLRDVLAGLEDPGEGWPYKESRVSVLERIPPASPPRPPCRWPTTWRCATCPKARTVREAAPASTTACPGTCRAGV